MSVSHPIPPAAREWAQDIVGPVRSARNVSHDRANSPVRELTCDTGRAFVKLSPNATFRLNVRLLAIGGWAPAEAAFVGWSLTYRSPVGGTCRPVG